MLDSETKRRIDTARDILVGKVPDPKSQVEQITIALIYKFMDDMDAESEEFGGKRKFFAKDFARYGWAKLMRSGLGGHETLNLYAEAIERMPENPGIPPLFRDIFKNAYLPYRDPETLRMFLKVIDEFAYDHSERLGDAFEYLLSVLGSQGDAGQFRTPRHIIDFMVAVVDPKKTETVLDPACGTAGFLISSYKHILKANADKKGHSTLTPDEKGRLAQNFTGYDISPDMVRLSLVNLYLHGFPAPHVFEYDTLTSQDSWNEYADVILANPPFMSPKGGIKPHNRFGVQSKRSEVLFVDYMAEHLAPNGRAAIIVPEGIIFQSQTAYKQLRKMLVENALVAVVSLPAGVFNPYAGVKTSILFLDKSLAKRTDKIAFYKVENDGFDLGAQRRPIDKNDLPAAADLIHAWLQSIRAGKPAPKSPNALVVEKAKVAKNGEYNLGGERYRDNEKRGSGGWPRIHLSDITIYSKAGEVIDKRYWNQGDELLYTCANLPIRSYYPNFPKEKRTVEGDILLARNGYGYAHLATPCSIYTNVVQLVKVDRDRALPAYITWLLQTQINKLQAVGQGIPSLNMSVWNQLDIPLPPLAVQKEIVAEIEGYQKVIDGARAVVDHYRPHIPIRPEWPIIKLGTICSFKNGLNFDKKSSGYTVKIIGVKNFQSHLYAPMNDLDKVNLASPLSDDYLVKGGDILFVRSNGNPDLVGRSIIVPPPSEPTTFSGFTIRGRIHDKRALPIFFAHLFKSRDFAEMMKTVGQGANIRNLSQGLLAELKISLPPLAEQRAIVAEIEAERELVDANRDLIARMEKKIQAVLARVWGEKPA